MSGEAIEIDRLALEQLAALLLERAGLKITPDGYYGLRLALLARLPKAGLSDATEYVRRLRQLAGEAELRALLPLVTVGKTEFFRDTKQFLAYEKQVYPALLEDARASGRRLKLWSAGCATGEEPYSLAMVALEKGGQNHFDLWATDLNPAAAESAALGYYQARRLIGLSEDRIQRFFDHVDGNYRVIDSVRDLVRFEAHNLAAPFWPQIESSSLDVIFCRNVIIYFDQPTIIGVMERFYDALRPGGWMFLGYSESLFKISTRFEMVEVGGTFAYLKPKVPRIVPTPLVGVSAPAPLPPTRPPAPRASELPPARPATPIAPLPRIDLKAPLPWLTPPPPPVVPVAAPSAPAPKGADAPLTPGERLSVVVAAIDTGDFPRALRLARRLVEDFGDDLPARLTLGNVYALMGSFEEAKESFDAALSREPLCVEARLFLGIAALQSGHLEDAKVELTRALFLEPTLSLGHYLLGQVHERRTDLEAARRAYRNAIKHRKAPTHELIGHFPELPRSNQAVAQSAQYRLAAISEQ